MAQAWFGIAGAAFGNRRWMAAARPAVAGQLVFVVMSFGALCWAFYHNDFSVLYVASNSNSALPKFYRIAAVWGAHEGSLLLWALALAAWTHRRWRVQPQAPGELCRARARRPRRGQRRFPAVHPAYLESVRTAASGGDRRSRPESAAAGPGARDPSADALHRATSALRSPFAFAVAALLEGRLDEAWARWARPWTTVAWIFLTIGIALGSWWAYYELGWGGWWFWDPVENASFMPWLVATALIHSLAVTEKRGLFKSWTLLLAIIAFSLSLLGTFLVRSGVLVSVHAFASRSHARPVHPGVPEHRASAASLALYAWRGAGAAHQGRIRASYRARSSCCSTTCCCWWLRA